MFTRISDCYRDTTAVVIGAGGIGGAIIQLLAGRVAKLVVADHDGPVLEKLALEKLAAGGLTTKLLTRSLDVRDTSAVTELFAVIETQFGAPHFLFYTAGILNIEPFAQ